MFRFKKALVVLVIYCIAAISFSQEISQGMNKEQQKGLVFSEQSYDFGLLESDSIVSHVFTFKNISNDTIKINRIYTH